MKIRFLAVAEIELDEAIEYYNHESPGLGGEFLTEILHALDRICRFPEAWHPCSKRGAKISNPAVPPTASFINKDRTKFS